jgi:hypothetical protein
MISARAAKSAREPTGARLKRAAGQSLGIRLPLSGTVYESIASGRMLRESACLIGVPGGNCERHAAHRDRLPAR